MKTKRKYFFIAAAITFGVWLITLGLFHERNVASSFHVESGDAWVAFENGGEIFCPSITIKAGNRRTIGVPYILCSISDRPPYSLSFCFTANVKQRVESITIESINVEYDDGLIANVVDDQHARTSTFELDDWGDKPYLRAGFIFSDCLYRRDSFWATILGSYTIGDETFPYKTRVRVDIRDETYWYPGWMDLMLRRL